MPKIKVPITPSVLTWAINQSGFSHNDIANELDVKPSTLKSWETGPDKPGITDLRALSRILRRQLAFFFLPSPPKTPGLAVQFRHPPGIGRRSLNPIEISALRENHRIQDSVSWIRKELNEGLAKIPQVRMMADPEKVSSEIRNTLGISTEDQTKWDSASIALSNWREVFQEIGILVFLIPMGKHSCRGFSIWNDHAPLIGINTWWNQEARIFTLFHEFAHLLTRTDSACIGFSTGRTTAQINSEERWCERFASSILMPWRAIESFLKRKWNWDGRSKFNNLKVPSSLSRQFKVSLRASTIRLISKGFADWDLYDSIPPVSDNKRGGGGGEGRKRGKIREDQFGIPTINTFAKAVHADIISRTEAISYLDIPDSSFEKAEQFVTRSR